MAEEPLMPMEHDWELLPRTVEERKRGRKIAYECGNCGRVGTVAQIQKKFNRECFGQRPGSRP